jgi:hypothetical protein
MGCQVAQPKGKVRKRKVRAIDEDAPKRDFARPVGDGTRIGARRIVYKIPKLFSGSHRKSRVVEVHFCPVAQKHRLSQTYDIAIGANTAHLSAQIWRMENGLTCGIADRAFTISKRKGSIGPLFDGPACDQHKEPH